MHYNHVCNCTFEAAVDKGRRREHARKSHDTDKQRYYIWEALFFGLVDLFSRHWGFSETQPSSRWRLMLLGLLVANTVSIKKTSWLPLARPVLFCFSPCHIKRWYTNGWRDLVVLCQLWRRFYFIISSAARAHPGLAVDEVGWGVSYGIWMWKLKNIRMLPRAQEMHWLQL